MLERIVAVVRCVRGRLVCLRAGVLVLRRAVGGAAGRTAHLAGRAGGPGSRGLGGADDRRVVWRAHRVQVQRARSSTGTCPPWAPGNVSNAIDQDDLYVEMTFAEVMDRHGPRRDHRGVRRGVPHEQVQPVARQRRRAAAAARPASRRRGPATRKYNVHANDIDFQIEADFIGLMAPGLPNAARDYSIRVGQVMNFGDGLYGGLFVTGMYAAAFFETDVRRVVEAGLALMPARQHVRRDHPRRARVAPREPGGLAPHLATDSGQVGHRGFVPGRRRCVRSTSTRGSTAPTSRWGCSTATATSRARSRSSRRARAGLRLQPVECRRHPGRDARLRSQIPDEWKSGHSGAGRPQVRLHELLVRRHRRLDAEARRSSWCGEPAGEVTADRLTIPRAGPGSADARTVGHGHPGSASSRSMTRHGSGRVRGRRRRAGRDGRPERGRVATAKGAEATLTFTGTARDDHRPLRGRRRTRGGDAGRQACAGDQRWIPQRTTDNASVAHLRPRPGHAHR